MSALDKAFLKAYAKGTAAPEAAKAKLGNGARAADSSLPEGPAAPRAVEAAAELRVHRIDAAHRGPSSPTPAPHAVLPANAELGGSGPLQEILPPPNSAPRPATRTPAQRADDPRPARDGAASDEVRQPSEASVEVPEKVAVDVPVGESASSAAEVQSQPTSNSMPNASASPAAPTVRCETAQPHPPSCDPLTPIAPAVSPVSLAVPVPTATSTVPPDSARTALQLPAVFLSPPSDEFSADWEVDRFSWPKICHQLLDAESRYFQHVGQRLKAATDEARHVVMIAGCRRGEGRTTLALCLARSAAQAGVRVALLDADLQHPQLGIQLGIDSPCGWLDALRGTIPLHEAAVASLDEPLTLFPLRAAQPQDNEQSVPGAQHWTDILRPISDRFPLTIVDTGPMRPEGPPLLVSQGGCPIDAAIVVRDLRNTSEQTAQAAARQLQQLGIAAVGIAENFLTR